MQEMIDSPSYKAGFLLGKMAQRIGRASKDESPKIASFEKSYVGLLSRRIADLDGVISLQNFINEKLNVHNVDYASVWEKQSLELTSVVKQLSSSSYNKQYCAFGFFEGYYLYAKKDEKTNEDTTESTN